MVRPKQMTLFEPSSASALDSDDAKRTARSGTFQDNMKLPVHRWFRYSAGFSADWVEDLVRQFAPAAVLDPFAGSGTAVLAAQAAGASAYGYESHPFVARIAAAKTHWNQSESEIADATKRLLAFARRHPASMPSKFPDLLGKCFQPEVLQDLCSIRAAYVAMSEDLSTEIAELLWLALTAILRSCSHVGTAQWQYVLPNKRKAKAADPFSAYRQKIAEMTSDIVAFRANRTTSSAVILPHDARTVPESIPMGSIDLVVTSPPYPNNYDYADATRLEMTFWGEIQGWGDLQEAVRRFIIRSCSQHTAAEKLKLAELLADAAVAPIVGDLAPICGELEEIRQTKGGKKAYHTMVAAYFCDLAKVLQALRPVCRHGCTMCFVVGDSAPYGVYVPADDLIGKLAMAAGFDSYSFEKLRDRNTKWKNRKHRVPLHEGRLWIKG